MDCSVEFLLSCAPELQKLASKSGADDGLISLSQTWSKLILDSSYKIIWIGSSVG